MRRIRSIIVRRLQNSFDYDLDFPHGSDNVIIIAPNGHGKTALLQLVQAALAIDLKALNGMKFDFLAITFVDGRRWEFKRSDVERAIATRYQPELDFGEQSFRTSRRVTSFVELSVFDSEGIKQEFLELDLGQIEPSVLLRALNRSRSFSGSTYQRLLESPLNTPFALEEMIRNYGPQLIQDNAFRSYIDRYAPDAIQKRERSKKCVFIDTQRLITQKSSANESSEEVAKQAAKLAKTLGRTYDDYTLTSQSLDRSFPNRLIARAQNDDVADVYTLRSDLDEIEAKRERLTEAGIFDDQLEQIVPPSDKLLPKVSDALLIYVEDSRKKLSTFDNIYPQVSVLREIVNSKLRPKELAISRGKGAEIVKGDLRLPLDKLSSGEKHVFVMLFKLIFETSRNSVVLIDEPEISLHVLWQLEFMGDLIKIQKANPFQSIIATHSPQIFQGRENIVIDLADQVK